MRSSRLVCFGCLYPCRLTTQEKEALFLEVRQCYNSLWQVSGKGVRGHTSAAAGTKILKLMKHNPGLEEAVGSCQYDSWWEQQTKGKRGREPWERLSVKKEGKEFTGWMYNLVWELAIGELWSI